MITVFTPTYNRANYLKNLYESLLKQTSKDFEWVIVDDGSTDNTFEIISNLIEEEKIKIVFEKKENEGKHIAINKGAKLASGELFFTVDSDDVLTDNALERIQYHWNKIQELPINERDQFIGLSANRMYPNGEVIGGKVLEQIIDADLLEFRFKMHIKGDKAEVYKTEVVRNNPFPQIDGENFCPEALIFYRLAERGYKLRYFNENIYIGEYLEGGLTNSGLKIVKNNPSITAISYADIVNFNKVPFLYKLKYSILYWRFTAWNKKISFFKKIKLLKNPFYFVTYPIGFLLFLKDKQNN